MRTTHHVRHCCAQNADHLAHGSPLSAFFAEVVCSLAATPPPVGAWPPPNGGNGVIRGTTRRRHAASDLLVLQNPHRHWCGRRRRDRGAWLRCPWAVAVPGWAIHSDPAPLVWRAPEGPRGLAVVPVGGGRAWLGFKPTRPATHQRPGPTGVEGAGGAGGPGCGARGRWRGLAGLRDDAPSEARGADGSRAGRRPRAHKAARPARALRRLEHPWGHKATRQHTAKGPKRRSASGPSRVSVAHRLSWMLRPGTASISSRV